MKVCEKCGLQQSDGRTNCIYCGKPLGNSLSRTEEEAVIEEMNTYHVVKLSLVDKIVGMAALIGFFIMLGQWFFGAEQVRLVIMSCALFGVSSFLAQKPVFVWELFKYYIRFSKKNANRLEPSRGYFIGNKIASYLCFAGAVVLFYFLNRLYF